MRTRALSSELSIVLTRALALKKRPCPNIRRTAEGFGRIDTNPRQKCIWPGLKSGIPKVWFLSREGWM